MPPAAVNPALKDQASTVDKALNYWQFMAFLQVRLNPGQKKFLNEHRFLTREDLEGLGQLKQDKPLFALMHWGREFADQAGSREQALTALLEDKGVEGIIGCHSDRASRLEGTRKSCRVFSYKNFLFDQDKPPVSGILLEAVFFPQGTYFLRSRPLNNLYRSGGSG